MKTKGKAVGRGLRAVLAMALLAGVVATGPAESAAGSDRRQSYTGTIDGADFRVEVPEEWNGTLLLYSHGYFPEGVFPAPAPEQIELTNSDAAEEWLLDHGYALAASAFEGFFGYQVERGYRDQLALLDWFEDNVGEPDRTVATGQSLGAPIAVLLAERNPQRFDGVATFCSQGYDTQGVYNASLDIGFAVKTLLAEGDENIELVRPSAPEASSRALESAIEDALTTPQGRARLALVASLNNVTGWFSAHEPEPTDPEEWIENQAAWIRNAYIGSTGFASPLARVDLEAKAGGNPSFNVGVDYHRQLDRSSQTELVEEAYTAAGLDLDADLDQLNAAPRVPSDPAAVAFMHRHGLPFGHLEAPMVTLHSVGDGGAVPDAERWYAQQVRRSGSASRLRQLYVDRGSHCSFSAADEIVALTSLEQRIDTGHWSNTSPGHLNATVGQFDPHFQQVIDLGGCGPTGCPTRIMPPAFTRFTPPKPMRPSL